ncbi:unnamed protein product [Amoebophrya sp. A120]|nr:unnamed protein product [Amoebophrya sp. A120]|eukprot:GSA120T00014336001.1
MVCRSFLLFAFNGFPATVVARNIRVDFDVPRYGPRCVEASLGDSVTFHWDEHHNLHHLASENDYRFCNFAAATKLANAGPNPRGVTVGPWTTAGDRFYSCSKICSTNGHKVRVCVATECTCSEGAIYNGESSSGGRSRRTSGIHTSVGERFCMMLAFFATAAAVLLNKNLTLA